MRSLARQIKESKLALELLLQLSRSSVVRDVIGTIQGCIFLVVNMLNSDDAQASRDSRELLDNLSFLDKNVIEMAKANFFKPLLQLLSSGKFSIVTLLAHYTWLCTLIWFGVGYEFVSNTSVFNNYQDFFFIF